MKKKVLKIATVVMSIVLIGAFAAACGQDNSKGSGSSTASGKYTVGICQLVQHEALDAATQGFKDALKEELGDDVKFDTQNASGDSATCATIVNGFVSDGVDLIMANATPALQAAASATSDIPILGTSITSYQEALELKEFDGVVGGNVSGTSDLAPLDEQAAMVKELFPDAKTVGILYCSGEANSVYQKDEVTKELEKLGFEVKPFTFTDSNDVSLVTQSACDECDVIYIPTDNTAASCADAIDAVARPAKTPIIAGEEGLCAGCGVATLTINYSDLGKATGKMAAKILKGEADISEMKIEYSPAPVKKFNPEIAKEFGLTFPDDYSEIEAEAEE